MLAKRNPVIGEAYCRLQVMSEDEANRMLYEARLKAQRDEYSRVHGAWQDGLERGLEKGESNATKKIVLEMNKYGMDANAIAAITHLSEGEVSALIAR
jgi:predicted transposase/invertase (TIGR01784 family)